MVAPLWPDLQSLPAGRFGSHRARLPRSKAQPRSDRDRPRAGRSPRSASIAPCRSQVSARNGCAGEPLRRRSHRAGPARARPFAKEPLPHQRGGGSEHAERQGRGGLRQPEITGRPWAGRPRCWEEPLCRQRGGESAGAERRGRWDRHRGARRRQAATPIVRHRDFSVDGLPPIRLAKRSGGGRPGLKSVRRCVR
jgi:hypothetical protein